jgi:hypothetical protein
MSIYFDITENMINDTDFIMDPAEEDIEYTEFNIEEPYYHDDIYLYQGAWYHKNFPVLWAMTHEADSGPSQCANCADYGCVNHVFIGYCANCAEYYYDGERGKGFIDNGIEIDDFESAVSAFDTYLKDVDISQIKPIYQHVDIDSDSGSDDDDIYVESDNIDSFIDDDFTPVTNSNDGYKNNIAYECAENVLLYD